ncbi:MAG: FxsA family protein [Actinomycetota bacterium]
MIWLFVAFIVLPVLEIYIITQVAGPLGWPLTIFLVIFVSLAGAWLVRREGMGVIRRLRDALESGRMPTKELADGAMIFFASALMLTPGFLTDAFGLALLIPPIRAVLRPPVIAFFRRRLNVQVANLGGMAGGMGGGPFGAAGAAGFGRGDVFDVDGTPVDEDEPGPAEDDGGTGSSGDRPELR